MTGPLEPTPAEQLAVLTRAAGAIVDHGADPRARPVTSSAGDPPFDLAAALGPGGEPVPWAQAVDLCVDLLAEHGVHPTHPRYFGLFNPTPAFGGVVADLLVSAFNPQLAARSHAPAACEVEDELIRFLAGRFGLPTPAGGFFTSGGAEANAAALHLALTLRHPGVAAEGVRALPGRPTVYASAESHLAWLKILHTSGLGRDALRLVPVDEGQRMRPDALRSMLAADREAGAVPVMVVATMGTTSAGAVDPVRALAAVARDAGTVLHVDAAWAGALCLSSRLAQLLDGIGEADSITVDPHKWMSMPLGCGALVTRHPSSLAATYHAATGYMPDPVGAAADPYTHSPQWSRRFRGLGLLLTLLTAGLAGYDRQLTEDVGRGRRLRRRLEDGGWTIVNDTELPVVCVADPAAPDDASHHWAVADAVVASGRAWVSFVSVDGRPAVRACVTSHRTTDDDVDDLVDLLATVRTEVRARR